MTDWHLQVKANVGEHRHLQVRVKPGADLGGGVEAFFLVFAFKIILFTSSVSYTIP